MNKLKTFAAVLSVSAACLMCSFNSGAEVYGENLEYIVCGNEVMVTGYKGELVTLSIPTEINGKKVTQIRENAFYRCKSLKKVVIPEGVEIIGHHAFYECGFLETAEIYGNLNKIAEGTFYGCSSLKNVILPEGMDAVENYGFYGCEKLRAVSLPDSVTRLGEYSFADCKILETVQLPESLVDVETCAFLRCDSLSEIEIPVSVMQIGNFSFGFSGEENPVPVEKFVISGGKDSLGETYAKQNHFAFENAEKEDSRERNFYIPGILIASSATGLLILKITEKAAGFRLKYEYET